MKRFFLPLLLGLLACNVQAAPFVVPYDANPPFHRDRLPIDTDSIERLSGQLTLLAQSASLGSPEIRRAIAQALALALSLDPSNSAARDNLTAIAKGESRGKPDDEKLTSAKDRIWKSFDWLANPEAGKDGNLLADLLGDAASTLDPGHPTSVSLNATAERGNWEGWVAPLSSFTSRPPRVREPLPENDPKKPDKAPDITLPSSLKPSTASIGAALFDYDEGARKFILRPTTVKMEASGPRHLEDWEEGAHDSQDFWVDINCREGFEHISKDNVALPIIAALNSKYDKKRLPDGKVRISTGAAGNYSNTRNQDDMTGPGFILANSAITGIAPNATIIACLDGPDKLALPQYFWSKVEALANGPGGRLVVPAAAAEYLAAVLVLGKPEFLFKYEVLLASSPEEAIALCSKVPDTSHAEIYAKFKEIKDKSGSGAVGTYLANRFVRQRLLEVSQAAPYHLSAKLLAMQGGGDRPRMLDKKILAAEIFQAIDPFQDFATLNAYDANMEMAQSMERAHEAARVLLDQLDRYAEIRDRDLVNHAKSLASDLRSVYREIQGRGEMWEKMDRITAAYKTMVATNKEVRAELSAITGDALPEDEQALERVRERKRQRFRNR